MAEFTVSISNCNSIDRAEIAIVEGSLNIKANSLDEINSSF